MTIVSWRNATLALAAVCCFQRWQSCTRASAPAKAAASTHDERTTTSTMPGTTTATEPPSLEVPKVAQRSFYGFKPPAWVQRLLPQPGENVRDYRDRMLPLAELAIAPQRARVARLRDDFKLDPHAREELDAAVLEASTAIENRVMAAIANRELTKPMAGVEVARDILDIVDKGNTRFTTALSADQRAQLATHRFDFADYLLFSAKWEDALHVLD
jgi:hypothetical protein